MDFKYPYTDFHELNLDWFLAQFKDLLAKWEQLAENNAEFKTYINEKVGTMEQTVQSFIDFVNHYFENLDVQQEINNKLDAMAASGELQAMLQPYFDAFVESVNDRIADQDGRITALDARMDTFTHLTDGSTTGDAELADIRVGFNGKTYASAGSAVRGCDELNNKQAVYIEDIADIPYLTIYNGSVSTQFTEVAYGTAEVIQGHKYHLSFAINTVAYNVYVYAKLNGTTILSTIITAGNNTFSTDWTATATGTLSLSFQTGGNGATYIEGRVNEVRENRFDINDRFVKYFNDNVVSYNHRGYNTEAPENTLPAFKLSRVHRFYGIETDISFTSDNIPICMHDDTLDRTTDGTGYVWDHTWAEIEQLDAGSWFSADYTGTKVPSLEECLTLCKRLGLKALLEIKIGNGFTSVHAEAIKAVVLKCGMQDHVKFICTNLTELLRMLAVMPDCEGGLVSNSSTVDDNIGYIENYPQYKLYIDSNSLTDAQVLLCNQKNIPVEFWIGDDSWINWNVIPTAVRSVTSNKRRIEEYWYNDSI